MSKHSYPWHLCPIGWWGAATDKDGVAFFWRHKPHLGLRDTSWFAGSSSAREIGIFDNTNWQNSALPIPEREKVLNGLAEISEWKNVPAADSYKYDIDFAQWQERRKQRISAGLIDVNDTGVVEMEDDLTWLAKNAKLFSEGECCAVRHPKNRKGYLLFPHNDNDDITEIRGHTIYTSYEILQRRRELGLNPENNQPDWSKAPEGTTHWYPHEGMRGKWFKYDQTYNLLFAWEGIDGWDKRFGFSDAFISNCIPHPEQGKSTEPQEMNAVTALYAFAGFLTSMKTPITFSERHLATPAADIAAAIIEANNLAGDSDFDNYQPPKWEPQEQEWNGEGLPPVGWSGNIEDTCEGRWYEGIIDFISDDWCVFTASDGQHAQSMCHINFERPKTATERKRKEFVSELLSLDFSMDGCSLTDIANGMYDWLIDNDMLKDGE